MGWKGFVNTHSKAIYIKGVLLYFRVYIHTDIYIYIYIYFGRYVYLIITEAKQNQGYKLFISSQGNVKMRTVYYFEQYETSGTNYEQRTDTLVQIMECSHKHTLLIEQTENLHKLTDQINEIQQYPPSKEELQARLPTLMAHLMVKRNDTRRIYRELLSTQGPTIDFDVDNILHEVERELQRTDKLLSLYPKRGTYH